MNTQITIHPKLQHYGLATGDLDAMIEWYRKVLGMTVNHRSNIPAIAQEQNTSEQPITECLLSSIWRSWSRHAKPARHHGICMNVLRRVSSRLQSRSIRKHTFEARSASLPVRRPVSTHENVSIA
jgi:hypothetical protein